MSSKFYREVLSKSIQPPPPSPDGVKRKLGKPPTFTSVFDRSPSVEPGTNLQPGTNLEPGPKLVPAPKLDPGTDLQGNKRIRSANGRSLTIHKASRVEHAHTAAEHMLLREMFKLASYETSTSRLLRSSVRALASLIGCHKNRCRDHLQALKEKLAIEEAEAFNSLAGTTEGARVWRIFDFEAILKRRDEAKLSHVVKTGSVYFVDPETGVRLGPGAHLQPGTNLEPGTKVQPGSSLDTQPGTNLEPGPGTNLEPLSTKNLIKESLKKESSSSVALVRQALADMTLEVVDDDAARQLIAACRKVATDATPEEIDFFIRAKGQKLRSSGGLLLAVPKCFEPACLAATRKGREVDKQPELETERPQTVEELTALIDEIDIILHDEKANESQKAGMAKYREEFQAKLTELRKDFTS